jgi:hypothetical protein
MKEPEVLRRQVRYWRDLAVGQESGLAAAIEAKAQRLEAKADRLECAWRARFTLDAFERQHVAAPTGLGGRRR